MARTSPQRSPGKGTLVDTWTYDATYAVAEDEELDGQFDPEAGRKTRKVAVELRLVKDFDTTSETPPFATRGVRFTVTCKEIDLSIQGTDIESLRLAMWAKLDERYDIKWEEWILVQVDPRSPYEGMGTGFVFGHKTVWRGVAFDGSVLLREMVTHGARGYRITHWAKQFKEKNGRTLACIPGSEANRDALDEFSRRVDAMRRQLAEFVKPDAIMHTLANLQASMSQVGRVAPSPRIEDKGDRED